jgi:hypothetical protein
MMLRFDDHFADPDGLFAALAAALTDLSPREQYEFTAALALLLLNQLPSREAALAALSEAREVVLAARPPLKETSP